MKNINDVIKKSKQFESLQKEIENGTLSQSILLLSKDDFYAYHFAKMLASLIFNDGKLIQNENFEKVEFSSHPDLKEYPAKDKLVVSDSQEIVAESFVKPVFANKKIFIIKNFDDANEPAQNKLLKVLEEPPKGVYFILFGGNDNQILPTIKSRCNKIVLEKVSREDIVDFLDNMQNAEMIASLCQNQIGRALELVRNKNATALFNCCLDVIVKLKASKDVIKFSSKILSYKEPLSKILEYFSLMIEDILFIKSGVENLHIPPIKLALSGVSEEYSVGAICQIQKALDKASKELDFQTNPTLVLENLLLNMLEVKYLCK